MGFKHFIEEYVRLSSLISIKNERMNASFFFAVMGALLMKKGIKTMLKEVYMNPIIHVLFVQPSRTGKGISLGVMNQFADYFKEDGETILNTEQIGEATDAALVGSVESSIAQRNEIKGLLPGDPDFINPIIKYGPLATADIISFPEAEEIFMTGAHKEGRMKLIQLAIDGNVDKLLASYPVKYTCTATIVGVTYFLDKEFEEIILKRGIFQRFYIVNQDLSIEDISERINLLNSESDGSREQIDRELQNLAQEITEVMNTYDPGIILMNKDALDSLKDIMSEITWELERKFIGPDLDLLQPYVTALNTLYYKMGVIAAVLNGRKKITHKEIEEVDDYAKLYWKSIVTDLLSRVRGKSIANVQKSINTTLEQNENKEGISEKDLKTIVKGETRCDDRDFKKALKNMTKNKMVIRTKKNLLKINPRR
jgi:hypothetical protein